MNFHIYAITVRKGVEILATDPREDFPSTIIASFTTEDKRDLSLIQRIKQIALNPDIPTKYTLPSLYVADERKNEDEDMLEDYDEWFS